MGIGGEPSLSMVAAVVLVAVAVAHVRESWRLGSGMKSESRA